MADSFVQYNGDDVETVFTVPFGYLDQTHVLVRVDGVAQTEGEGEDYIWATASTIEFAIAPPTGTLNVEIIRETPRDLPQVDFNDGSTLGEIDLDNAVLQLLYIIQEAFDSTSGIEGSLPSTVGQSGKWLTNNGIAAQWATFLIAHLSDATAFGKAFLALASAAAARSNLDVYSTGQVDAADAAVAAAAIAKSIADAAGDLLVASGPDAWARLAKGSEDFVLSVVSGALAWRKDRRKCVLVFGNAGSSITQGNTRYLSMGGAITTEEVASNIVPFKGVARRLYITASSALGGSGTSVGTLRKNETTDTALVATIASGQRVGSDLSNEVEFAAGDLIALKLVAGADVGVIQYKGVCEYEEIP